MIKFRNLWRKIQRTYYTKIMYSMILLSFFIVVPVCIYWIFKPQPIMVSSCPKLIIKDSGLAARISLGDKTLIKKEDLTSDQEDTDRNKRIESASDIKEKGTQAFTKGKCEEAKQLFTDAKKQFGNDPETIIYLNNVQVGDNPLKIAVSVPTGNKSSIAQEILRGVAYAQSEVNKTGINDRKLLVEIINDDNDKEVVKKVAQELVTDPTIVAVIGHNKSSSSLAAARIYEDKLVMVSPTSTADNLSNFNKFIFRSVLTNKKMTKALATYVVESVKEAKIAICFAKSDINSKSFREVFIESVKEKGGTVYPICDLSDKNFNIDSKLKEIKRKANALLLVPDLNNLQVAVKLANANQGELALFAEPTMYTQETLEGNVEGLVVVAPWHGSMSKKFDGNMESFWGGKVNWRTATAYDATRAIIVGLQEEQTRQGLQKVLRSKEFKAEGENGEIEFDDVSGDRLGTPVILKVSGGEFRNITDSKL